METGYLMVSVLLSAIGMGLFVFGKKQGRPIHLLAGLGLMICPFFITNTIALTILGVVMTVVPLLL
jgi:hypothetical protein